MKLTIVAAFLLSVSTLAQAATSPDAAVQKRAVHVMQPTKPSTHHTVKHLTTRPVHSAARAKALLLARRRSTVGHKQATHMALLARRAPLDDLPTAELKPIYPLSEVHYDPKKPLADALYQAWFKEQQKEQYETWKLARSNMLKNGGSGRAGTTVPSPRTRTKKLHTSKFDWTL